MSVSARFVLSGCHQHNGTAQVSRIRLEGVAWPHIDTGWMGEGGTLRTIRASVVTEPLSGNSCSGILEPPGLTCMLNRSEVSILTRANLSLTAWRIGFSVSHGSHTQTEGSKTLKTRQLSISVLIACLALVLTWAGTVLGSGLEPSSTTAQKASGPLSLNINLGQEPPTLDPALAADSTSVSVIEQLFIGLVDLDDETAQVRPELATSWIVSPDDTVYTFTLRSDVTWSDGNPVTAEDVQYGILRSLDPQTGANYAYPLYVIKNAMAYNAGAITDTNQIGVTAVDTTTLRIALEYPASYALSILSFWVARPMPRWAIEAHGVLTWTEPANIVTNGAYRLTEWAHDDHILLDKNLTYHDASSVQIEQVKMWMVDTGTAWQMYLDGQLDTAAIPSGASLDPILRQEMRVEPKGCTYYYGFNVSQPPCDDPLVRKALIAATNRRGLIDHVLGGPQQPALTYTPPGVFGHVDGYTEGVGIPYSPSQAQQWLANAGYPNGQGLPPITLSFNTSTSHQAIAEHIRDNWYATTGVNVTLQSLPWNDYVSQLWNGQLQIWQLGQCWDYPDAYNFLDIGDARAQYGNWNNTTYEDLLGQAAREQNPAARKALYMQAEEILVETDAVMMPLYYYASTVAGKPYLEQTHGLSSLRDIATWRITQVSDVIDPKGGDLISYDGSTTVQLPAGVITETVVITQSPAYGMPPGGNLADIGHTFDVTAVYSGTGQPAQVVPGHTFAINVQYADAERGPIIENTLGLYWWDEGASQWSQQGITSSANTSDNLVTAQADHFSLFAVLGEGPRVYLPVILRNHWPRDRTAEWLQSAR